MTARKEVEAELKALRVADVAPGVAAVARILAARLDAADNGSATANLARELLKTMQTLRALAPPKASDDALDELTKKRESRRRRSGTAG